MPSQQKLGIVISENEFLNNKWATFTTPVNEDSECWALTFDDCAPLKIHLTSIANYLTYENIILGPVQEQITLDPPPPSISHGNAE